MITVPSHDSDPHPGHIHNLGQGSYAHHARCSFRSAERGTCRVVLGGIPFVSVSVSGDLRDSRGITGATEQPVQIVAPNLFGACRQALRSLPFTRIHLRQKSLRGLSDLLHLLRSLLADGITIARNRTHEVHRNKAPGTQSHE